MLTSLLFQRRDLKIPRSPTSSLRFYMEEEEEEDILVRPFYSRTESYTNLGPVIH